jgi:DNA-binding NarL/FixJ family response regulator
VAERVLVLAQDLIWADRLTRAVTEAGATPTRLASDAALDAALSEVPGALGPSFVIVDLTARTYEPFAAIERARAAGAHCLAVGQHDDVAQRKRALAAGAERVLAYRKLFEDGPATIRTWLDRAATAPASAASAAGSAT